MTDAIISWVETIMTMPGFYPLVATLVMVDALFPAVPSESILTLAGAWNGSQGYPSLWMVVLFAVAGGIVGDNACYMLGTRLITFVNRIPAQSKRGRVLEQVRKNMRRQATVAIIAARFIPWGRWLMTVTMGSVRYPWFRFLFWDTIGLIIWAVQSVVIGYVGGFFFQDNPLIGLVAGITLGVGLGMLLQNAQARLADWRDTRKGVSAA